MMNLLITMVVGKKNISWLTINKNGNFIGNVAKSYRLCAFAVNEK